MNRRKYSVTIVCVMLFGVCVFAFTQFINQGVGEIEVSMHPYVGYVFNPLYQKGINKLGFYGPLPQKEDKTKFKVGIFGGSVAYMYAITESDALQTSIAAHLGVAPKQVALYSFALPGFKQPQQLMTLTYLYSLGYTFDLIINIDGFNESTLSYVESYRQGVSSYFPRNWYIYSRGVPPVDVANLMYVYQLLRNLQYKAARYSWGRTYVAQKIWGWAYYQILSILNARLKAMPSSYQTKGPEAFVGTTETQVKRDIIRTWKESTLQMSRIAQANGAKYIEFIQPNQYLPNTKRYSYEEMQKFINKKHPYAEVTENIYPQLIKEAQTLKNEKVTIIDFSKVFMDTTETIYTDDCCHYNKKGHQIVTSAMMRSIVPLLQKQNE